MNHSACTAIELAGDVRTVRHLATYFQELKQTAGEMAVRITAQERGYFTPTEDDATKAVLVSYWQARNALFDLVTTYREDRQLSDEQRPVAFLTAFAATLLLIDAARFLRETVDGRPVVRRKLNEAAPQLGVPNGIYDLIQKSLVSTRHAWHVYHAIQYFETHGTQFREIRRDSEIGALLEIIDRLKHRMDVSIAQFARAKLRTRSSQLLRGLGRDTLGRALYGLHKFGGNMVADRYLRRGRRPALSPAITDQLRTLLTPGDVLVVRKDYALTNYFLPGYWPHVALYLGDANALTNMGLHEHANVLPRWRRLLEASLDEPRRVLEAMRDGVQIRSLNSAFRSDSIVVLRPKLSPPDVARGLARGLAHEGKPYDFDFDFTRADRLVCTEVVFRAFDGLGPICLPLTRRAGRLTLSGNDLIELALRRDQFEAVAAYVPQVNPDLVQGAATDELIRTVQPSQ